jgi:hypothetical protein
MAKLTKRSDLIDLTKLVLIQTPCTVENMTGLKNFWDKRSSLLCSGASNEEEKV